MKLTARYAASGPEGTFYTNDRNLAEKLFSFNGDLDSYEWTITDLSAPSAVEEVPDYVCARFGLGALTVTVGTQGDQHAVWLSEAVDPGPVGELCSSPFNESDVRVVLHFPTMERADAVYAALLNRTQGAGVDEGRGIGKGDARSIPLDLLGAIAGALNASGNAPNVLSKVRGLICEDARPTQSAVAKLVNEWLFDDGYLTGNPKIDEPTIHRAQAKRECSQQLRAALAGQPKGESP